VSKKKKKKIAKKPSKKRGCLEKIRIIWKCVRKGKYPEKINKFSFYFLFYSVLGMLLVTFLTTIIIILCYEYFSEKIIGAACFIFMALPPILTFILKKIL
jgi:hypothetical protein